MEIPFQVLILISVIAPTTTFGKYILLETEEKAKGKEDQDKVTNELSKY